MKGGAFEVPSGVGGQGVGHLKVKNTEEVGAKQRGVLRTLHGGGEANSVGGGGLRGDAASLGADSG